MGVESKWKQTGSRRRNFAAVLGVVFHGFFEPCFHGPMFFLAANFMKPPLRVEARDHPQTIASERRLKIRPPRFPVVDIAVGFGWLGLMPNPLVVRRVFVIVEIRRSTSRPQTFFKVDD